MTRRAYYLTLASFAAIALASLMMVAYLYGKISAKAPVENASAATRTRILLGKIVRIEPLHIYVESASLGSKRTYDVLISPQTQFLQLVDWAPGEKEAAIKAHDADMERRAPKAGDPAPAPPMQMKPGPLAPSSLVPGTMVGIGTDLVIDAAKPIVAGVIRPLTPEEAASGQVANTFPLQ